MQSIDQVLKGSTSQSEIAAAQSQPADKGEEKPDLNGAEQSEPETVETKPELVKTEEKPKAEVPASSAEAKHETTIPLATFKGVEKRLQEAERRLREREEKDRQPAPEVPDVLTDQEGFRKRLQDDTRAEIFDRAVAISEDFAKRTNADFATVMGTDESGTHHAWIELAKTNRHLVDEFRNSANPALFAYEAVKREKAMSEIGDPLTYRERIEKEIRASMSAEAIKQPTRPEIPESLADEPSKAPRKAPEYSGPTPIKDIVGKPWKPPSR